MEPRPAHVLAFEKSLALHEAVAERLRRDPSLVERARARVAGWRADGSVAPRYVERWSELLSLPLEALLRQMTARDEASHDLRQVSPFAGLLDPRTRWGILRAARARSTAS